MPVETVYADLVLAVAALIAGALYLRARRRHVTHKKSGPPVRPATPTPQAAMPARGAVTTWAPPPPATPGAAVAPTIVAPPSPSWDQPASKPAAAGGWSGGSPAPAWGAPAAGAPPPPPPPPPPAPPPAPARGGPCRSIGGRPSPPRQAIRRRVV